MAETKRPRGNPAWQKGGPSPNAGGRPKLVHSLRERALKAVDDHVVAAWVDEVEERERVVGHTMEGDEITKVCRGKDWVQCGKLLAEYGMGKPVQPVASSDVDGNDTPLSMTVKFVRPPK